VHQTCVGKTDFGLAGLLGDFEYNIGAVPLALVLQETQVAVRHAPNHFFPWDEFRDLLLGTVHILVAIGELGAKFLRMR
jgi:hypothetical protein